MNDDILHKLKERIKELTALHCAARVLQDNSKRPEQIVLEIALLLPPAWQFPEITVARIKFADTNCTTPGFRETRWAQRANFPKKVESWGSIEVYYLEQRPPSDEGPFLREERDLIESLADMLGSYFQRRWADQELRTTLDSLEAQVRLRTRELSEVNAALLKQVAAYKDAQLRIESYQGKLRRLTSELSLAEARERRTIAEDLHDHIGQALAFTKMNISSLRGNAIFCGFEDNMDRIMTLLDQTIRYTRDLTFEISPPILYELGLVATLDWLADRFRHKHDIAVSIEKTGPDHDIDADRRFIVFKSVQELLVNVAKHSGANVVVIRMENQIDQLLIKVIDDGRGFDINTLETSLPRRDEFGLFNIRERLEYLGGIVQIASSPGKGTSVTLSLPLNKGIGNGDTLTPRR
jgi:signal transduction histidine kinase